MRLQAAEMEQGFRNRGRASSHEAHVCRSLVEADPYELFAHGPSHLAWRRQLGRFVASVLYHRCKRRFPRIFARAGAERRKQCIEEIEEGNDADAASTKHAGACVTRVYLQYMHSIFPIHNYHHGVPNTVSKK